MYIIKDLSFVNRHAYKSTSYNGKISSGSVRVVQLGHSTRRTSRCYQQETLARNH